MKMIVFANISDITKFAIYEHNLTDDDAENEVRRLRGMGFPALTIPQDRLHMKDDCPECVREVMEVLSGDRRTDDETG